jgi:hypothetical protein
MPRWVALLPRLCRVDRPVLTNIGQVVTALIIAALAFLALRGGLKVLRGTQAKVSAVRAKSGRLWLAAAGVVAVGFAVTHH